MQNEPGRGPTRPDKTAERMAQERQSPGATSAGGHGADASDNDTSRTAESSADAGPSLTSANTAARRGDVAATDPAGMSPDVPPDMRDRSEDAAALSTLEIREARIRETAYRIFHGRHASEGDAMTDWLQAEKEVEAVERDADVDARSEATR